MCIEFWVIQKCTIRGESLYEIRPVFFALMKKVYRTPIFGIMKSELLYAEKFNSPEEFVKALEEYIVYYNNKRIKSRLKGKSPVQFRTLSQSN